MNHLQELIQTFSNENLLEQYIDHQQDYTPDALKTLKSEIDRRQISQDEIDAYLKQKEVITDDKKTLDSSDFVSFDHAFSHTDILLATAVLKDSKVIFFVDNPDSTAIPLESEASKRFTIHVHKDSIEKAHELLDEHFVKEDGMYSFKYAAVKERLKAFSFHDLHLTEYEAAESIEVGLTNDECRVIIHYGNRLLNEVDEIETKQERVVFYYDAIESLIQYLESKNNNLLSRTDLLTILEILQIYCEDSEFPTFMDETISTIMGFFLDA